MNSWLGTKSYRRAIFSMLSLSIAPPSLAESHHYAQAAGSPEFRRRSSSNPQMCCIFEPITAYSLTGLRCHEGFAPILTAAFPQTLHNTSETKAKRVESHDGLSLIRDHVGFGVSSQGVPGSCGAKLLYMTMESTSIYT